MSGFDHECEGSMDVQTAQGKLPPNSNRFQIHCWWWENTVPRGTYHQTWYMRFGNDWYKYDNEKHLSFTVTITHCPFCGVDFEVEWRKHWLKEIHKTIKNRFGSEYI